MGGRMVSDRPTLCECGHAAEEHETSPYLPCLVEARGCDGFEPLPPEGVHVADPRSAIGLAVESAIQGPFEVKKAKPSLQGGTLDRGIVARTEEGQKIVIGEIWARCPGEDPNGVRIDADAVARGICRWLNECANDDGEPFRFGGAP